MVLLVPCFSATLSTPAPISASSCSMELFYEVPSSLKPPAVASEPIPLRRSPSQLSGSASLSSSTESVCSWRSTTSSVRSAAERERERASCLRLLDVSVAKLHQQRDPPLRKHLHVVNTIKAIQRDLEMLDDEEVECAMLTESPMEVDEWPRCAQPLNPVQEAVCAPWRSSRVDERHQKQQQQQQPEHRLELEWSLPTTCAAFTSSSASLTTGNCWPSSAGASSSTLWAHLDDFSANPLEDWTTSDDSASEGLTSLFASHLHRPRDLLLQA